MAVNIMHNDNIELLRNEALRLVQLCQETLKKISDVPDLLAQQTDGSDQTLDAVKVKNHLDVLKGERLKLEQMDMVLAVVGTMKAGKSTTINAIVGTEILPNRNAPMTAIPTLIRHTPGQTEPVLHLQNLKPLNLLRAKLKNKLSTKTHAKEMDRIRQFDDELQALVEDLQVGADLTDRHEGSEQIFEALKKINDLVRLAPLLKLNFPFEEFQDVNTLPLIKVEFSHLKGLPNQQGTLTLLDTPGPNEAGQTHLRYLLEDQLEKASGVLTVMDYTQLKSEADAEVREQIRSIADIVTDRLFVLVNKFDQKDSRGMDAAAVKAFVAGLMNHSHDAPKASMQPLPLSADRVFPVSARFAYLANRARHQINLHGELPVVAPKAESWVADFGATAFGMRWENKVTDTKAVLESAADLWKDSNFQAPLEAVIQSAFANAALLSVDSAADKLCQLADAMRMFCESREKALSQETAKLKQLIEEIRTDIQTISNCEINAKTLIDSETKEFNDQLLGLLEESLKGVRQPLDDYFATGKSKSLALTQKKDSTKARNAGDFSDRIRSLFGNEPNSEQQDYDPDEPVINFGSDKSKAEEWLARIEEVIQRAELDLTTKASEALTASRKKLVDSLNGEVMSEATTTVSVLHERLHASGFDGFTIKLPEVPELNQSGGDAKSIKGALEVRPETRSRLVEQEGVFGSLKRGLGWLVGIAIDNEIGHDREDYTVMTYKIDMSQIRQTVDDCLNESLRVLQKDVKNRVQQPTTKAISKYFKEFRAIVEGLRGNLLQGLQDQQLSQSSKEALRQNLRRVSKQLPGQVQDTAGLKEEARVTLTKGVARRQPDSHDGKKPRPAA